MGWFKMWDELWLSDEKINALTLEEQGAFVRIMALASKSLDNGRLSFEGEFPRSYTQTLQAAGVTQNALDTLLKNGFLVKNGDFYEVKNWRKYQSEYQRQKGYRSKLHEKVTSKGTPVDVDGDVDLERDKEKGLKQNRADLKTTHLPPGRGKSTDVAHAISSNIENLKAHAQGKHKDSTVAGCSACQDHKKAVV